MKLLKPAKSVGRPRQFDPDQALGRALEVFWKKGYEGTSLSDLTDAMGINRPSLYAVFGNKEDLFRKALDRYSEAQAASMNQAMNQPTARGAVEQLLMAGAESMTNPHNPHGCLLVQGALACGEGAECIRQELVHRRAAIVAALRQRLERAKSEGDLPLDSEPGDLARYVSAVSSGLSVMATGGASRNELRRVVQTAMRAWPK
jgi:AcrR family transcriptional regulator